MRGSRHSTLSLSFKNSIAFLPFFENGIHRIQNHTINIQSLTSLLILLTNCQVEKLPSGLCDFLEISCKAQKARHVQIFSLNYPLFALISDPEQNARSLLTPVSHHVCMLLHKHMVNSFLFSKEAFSIIFSCPKFFNNQSEYFDIRFSKVTMFKTGLFLQCLADNQRDFFCPNFEFSYKFLEFS